MLKVSAFGVAVRRGGGQLAALLARRIELAALAVALAGRASAQVDPAYHLTPQAGQQKISDIQTDFATAQNVMKDATARQAQAKTAHKVDDCQRGDATAHGNDGVLRVRQQDHGRAAGGDPGKTVLDLAVAIALGGDCLADVGVLWAESVAAEVLVFLFLGPRLLRVVTPTAALAMAASSGLMRWAVMAQTADVAALEFFELRVLGLFAGRCDWWFCHEGARSA